MISWLPSPIAGSALDQVIRLPGPCSGPANSTRMSGSMSLHGDHSATFCSEFRCGNTARAAPRSTVSRVTVTSRGKQVGDADQHGSDSNEGGD